MGDATWRSDVIVIVIIRSYEKPIPRKCFTPCLLFTFQTFSSRFLVTQSLLWACLWLLGFWAAPQPLRKPTASGIASVRCPFGSSRLFISSLQSLPSPPLRPPREVFPLAWSSLYLGLSERPNRLWLTIPRNIRSDGVCISRHCQIVGFHGKYSG